MTHIYLEPRNQPIPCDKHEVRGCAFTEAIHKRLDEQDKVLDEIRQGFALQAAENADMKPALMELVSLWRGSRLIGGFLLGIAGIVGAIAAFFEVFIRGK